MGYVSPYTAPLITRPFDRDSASYFARAGALSLGQRQRIDRLVFRVKKSLGLINLADGFDGFWLLANETSAAAYKNAAKDDHHGTAHGTVTFTAIQGVAGNGTDGYLSMDYFPSTDAVSWSINSMHASVYVRNARTDNATVMSVSSRVATPSAIELGPRVTGNTILRANDNGAGTVTPAQGSTSGFWIVNRSAAGAVQKYRNQTTLTATTDASVSVPTAELVIGARNTAGTISLFSTDQHAFASIGRSLSAAEQAAFQRHVEDYLDAMTAGAF